MEVTEGASGGAAPGFHKIELLRTTWEMPVNYQDPQPLGVGAYGQVWWAIFINFFYLVYN